MCGQCEDPRPSPHYHYNAIEYSSLLCDGTAVQFVFGDVLYLLLQLTYSGTISGKSFHMVAAG